MEEVLKALGYPATAVFTFLIMGYFGQKIFENILKGSIEDRKAELCRETERLKAELGRETERLKTQLGVEAEVYRLAAQKRFASLIALWESSQALFEGTDFSNRDSIKASLGSLDLAVRELDKSAVLMSVELSKQIRIYLKEVGIVLTNSEDAFNENAINSEKIGQLFKNLSGPIGVFSPGLSIVAAIGAELIPSIGKALEKKRHEAATAARVALEGTLRREFGVWISEERALDAAPVSHKG